MERMAPPFALTREQILAHRRRVGALDRRLPPGPNSLRRAAWAGLQDSMPRAAVLSIHARVTDTRPSTFEDPSLVQVWGPRFSAFVVAAQDRAVFTLGRLPDDERRLRRAQDMADRLEAFLGGRRMPYEQAGREMGLNPNTLRYAAPTGRVLIHWDGARSPTIWTVPPPDDGRARRTPRARAPVSPHLRARAERTRSATGRGSSRRARTTSSMRWRASCVPVRTPVGDDWILAADESSFRASPEPPAPARLLPSGDAYFLAWGADRELLVFDADRRPILWTPRVWPGALLLEGEIAGVWRRQQANVSIEPWRSLTPAERQAIEAEAVSLPLPGLEGAIVTRWAD